MIKGHMLRHFTNSKRKNISVNITTKPHGVYYVIYVLNNVMPFPYSEHSHLLYKMFQQRSLDMSMFMETLFYAVIIYAKKAKVCV